MNFLAHLYLSGPSDKIKIGNFIADSIKGNKYLDYPEEIQKGILLHRSIDKFTDTHTISHECAKFFNPKYRKYSPVVVDIIYDHFLARNWDKYHTEKLHSFVNKTNILLLKNYFILPAKMKKILPFLIKNKRLENYASIEGINTILEIMPKYTSLPKHNEYAIEQLKNKYEQLDSMFDEFFTDIIEYVRTEHNINLEVPIY